MAMVAEQTSRFDDMVSLLELLLDSRGPRVSIEERNLISVAFKKLISPKREACRKIEAISENPKYSNFRDALNKYKKTVQQNLIDDC